MDNWQLNIIHYHCICKVYNRISLADLGIKFQLGKPPHGKFIYLILAA